MIAHVPARDNTVQEPTKASEDKVPGCAAAIPVEKQNYGEWSTHDSLADDIPFECIRDDEDYWFS